MYLVNTGWIGGGYGVGHRIELAYTRSLVARALDGTIEDSEFVHDDIFNVDIPTTCHGVPDGILVPRQYWQSTARYDEAAHNLAVMFEENFEKKYSHLPESVKAAGPHAQVHADAGWGFTVSLFTSGTGWLLPVIAVAACWESACKPPQRGQVPLWWFCSGG